MYICCYCKITENEKVLPTNYRYNKTLDDSKTKYCNRLLRKNVGISKTTNLLFPL